MCILQSLWEKWSSRKLFCYLFNSCVRRDLVGHSGTFSIILNRKWQFVMEKFTEKRCAALDKLLTERSQNILHDEVAAASATHFWCHNFLIVCLVVKQCGFSKFKLSRSEQHSGYIRYLKIKTIKVSYEKKWSIWGESA